MSYRVHRCHFALVAATAVALGGVTLSGCGSSEAPPVAKKYQAADSEAADAPASVAADRSSTPATNSPQKPPTVAASQFTSLEVPDGTPEELIKFIEELQVRQPSGATEAEIIADVEKVQRARMEAANRIIKADVEDETIRQTAVNAKLDSLRVLAEIGKDVEQDIRDFSAELAKDKDPALARLGHVILFGMKLGEVASKENPDLQPIMADLKTLLEKEGAKEEVFSVARQAAMIMQQLGENEMAAEAYMLIGTTFAESDNPQLVELAGYMADQGRLLSVEFDSKLDAAIAEQPNAIPTFMAAAKQVLETNDPGAVVLQNASQAAQTLEFTRHYDAAEELFAMIASAYTDHPNEELSQQAEQVVDYGQRRVGLIGKPFEVKGRLLDGSQFDWSQYKGKVVLVDFWATWCEPCIGEIPNIKQAYEKYHDKGFEVVGVNLDDSDEAVERFLAQENLPWTTVRSADPQAAGMGNPLAVSSGVDAIPFVLLVNREGNVESLHVRGEVLDEELERLMGPAGDAEKTSQSEPIAETAPTS